MTQQASYFELADSGLISFSGDEAVAFLQGQLTSDVAALAAPATGYAGYCSPKGRLLATFLLWRLENEILLQLPMALRDSIQTRLARYVLRAKVKVADASSRYRLFGVAGAAADAALARGFERIPASAHQVASDSGVHIAALPVDRYVLLVEADRAADAREKLDEALTPGAAADWSALDVAAGVPVVTAAAQEEYVPQMVNLDLVGGVSFSKGCYPGQEIVARMHYLGRLKQRMYRVRVAGTAGVTAGTPLYSPEFGAEQASGAILCPGAPGEALAVIQKSSADAGDVRYGALDGPRLEFLPLPYNLPE